MELFLDNLEHFLAAKEMIEGTDANGVVLSKYIEDFEKVPDYLNL